MSNLMVVNARILKQPRVQVGFYLFILISKHIPNQMLCNQTIYLVILLNGNKQIKIVLAKVDDQK